jgi:hypothetical protein
MSAKHEANHGAKDWSYRDARRRLVAVGDRHLRHHTASGRLDEHANRIVDCSCGWTGNALGWAGHLDQVVRAALDGAATRQPSLD